MKSASETLAHRLAHPRIGLLDIWSELRHFALITYAVPIERIRPHLHERFEVVPFEIEGQTCGLISAVPFLDEEFHFAKFPLARFQFGQTNHRVYVRDRETDEHVVWFFGTTLGSRVVHLARALWRIPWHEASYSISCAYDRQLKRYSEFRYDVRSEWCGCDIELVDTGEEMRVLPGFSNLAEQVLILTHPVEGYFHRLDDRLGTYSVWHEEIPLTIAKPKQLYFSLYERLELLSREEMKSPHSCLIAPQTKFLVRMPPRAVRV